MNAHEIKKIAYEAEQAKIAHFLDSSKSIFLDKIYPMIDYIIKTSAQEGQYKACICIHTRDFFNGDDVYNTAQISNIVIEYYKCKALNIKGKSYNFFARSGSCDPTIHFNVNWE